MLPRRSRLEITTASALAASLIGAIWSGFFRDGCPHCDQARSLTHPLHLTAVGLIWYSLLIAAVLYRGLQTKIQLAILFSAAVHIALLVLLIMERLYCPPCLLAAAGALTAATLVLISDSRARMMKGAFVLVAFLFAALTIYLVVRHVVEEERQDLLRIGSSIVRQHAPPQRGRVMLFVLTRPGCSYCDQLKAGPLPELIRQNPGQIESTELTAPNEIPSPSTLFRGSTRACILPGLRTVDELQTAMHFVAAGAQDAIAIPGLLEIPLAPR